MRVVIAWASVRYRFDAATGTSRCGALIRLLIQDAQEGPNPVRQNSEIPPPPMKAPPWIPADDLSASRRGHVAPALLHDESHYEPLQQRLCLPRMRAADAVADHHPARARRTDPRAAIPRLRLRPCQQGALHPGDRGLARTSIDHQHGRVHRAGAYSRTSGGIEASLLRCRLPDTAPRDDYLSPCIPTRAPKALAGSAGMSDGEPTSPGSSLRTTRAGLPAAKQCAGMFEVTTLPAPIAE
jgi:hypothetical protein